MNIVLLFLLLAASSLGAKAFSKLCSNMLAENSVAKYSLVLILTSLIACGFFFVSGGFHLAISGMTLLYSAIYALVVAVSVVSNLMVYRYASISDVNVTTSACGMICTALIGYVFFAEEVSLRGILRLAIMLAAIVLVFLDQKQAAAPTPPSDATEKDAPKGSRHLTILIVLLGVVTLAVCANTIVLKLFTASPRVTDQNSFFFFTNVVLAVFAAVALAIDSRRHPGTFSEALTLLQPRKLVSMAGNTVCSNIGSIVSVLIVAQMDVSIYSPLTTAIGILVGLVGSWIFCERLGRFSYLAAAVSVVVIFL